MRWRWLPRLDWIAAEDDLWAARQLSAVRVNIFRVSLPMAIARLLGRLCRLWWYWWARQWTLSQYQILRHDDPAGRRGLP